MTARGFAVAGPLLGIGHAGSNCARNYAMNRRLSFTAIVANGRDGYGDRTIAESASYHDSALFPAIGPGEVAIGSRV